MSENKIRGGALLARALKDKGISKVFTLSGGFCNPAIEGFAECQIEVINTPHEQIAGHLADGNTRITRKPSVCLVGPEGFTNACLLYTSPSPRDKRQSRMPSSA